MRTHHWLTAFLSGMVLLSAATQASAQYPPPGATGQANYSAVGYDGIPPGFNPYPTISPYDNVFDQTFEDNGIWMRNANNTDYKHRFAVDALFSIVRKGGGKMVGSPNANRQIFFRGGPDAIDNSDLGEFPAIDPDAALFDNGRSPFFPKFTDFLGQATGHGIQATYTIEGADGQTFELSGFGLPSATAVRELGRPIQTYGPVDDPLFDLFADVRVVFFVGDEFEGPENGAINPEVPTYLVNVGNINGWMPAVPLNDGTTDGTLMRVDHYYKTAMNTQAYGAGFTWGHTPSAQWGPFSVQTSFGVRYINIKEHFAFRGHDSGLDYELEFDPDEAEYGTPITIFQDGSVLPTRTSLDSYSDVDMAGPELGLRYTAGGDSFSLLGESKLGVMGAQERLLVNGQGLGQRFIINDVGGNLPISTNPFYNEDARTSRYLRNSYVTPTFQQTINTRSKLLSALPLVREIGFFREANFSAGYSILMAFQVSRPDSSIEWNANTGFDPTDPDLAGLAPEPVVDRRMWFVQYFNLGVEWEY